MDIKFSAEDIAFRDEVRAFFAKEYDATVAEQLSGSAGTDYKSAIVNWQKKLHAKGWIAPGWPKEYGGTGWTSTQKFIYETERGLAGIPDGVKMINGLEYQKIDDKGLHVTNNGIRDIIEVDTVVICAGQLSNRSLYDEVVALGADASLIGGAFEAAELDAKAAINQASYLAAEV